MEGKVYVIESKNLCNADVAHKEIWDGGKPGQLKLITYSPYSLP
jgi:hypothetical protein